MLDGDAVQRFLAAADDCHFGPAPTWSIEGLKQIGGAVSTIMSSTDYIANYFAGNNYAQVSFSWKSPVDMTNAESIAAWINSGLQNRNADVFNNLIDGIPSFWGLPMPDCWGDNCPPCEALMGQWCVITKSEFIQEINIRIDSNPQCAYWAGNRYFGVDTYGWDPLWTWPFGEADLMNLGFFRENEGEEYVLKYVEFHQYHIDPLSVDGYLPCP